MRVTVQDHKPLLALVDDCITVELERELFTVELRALVDFGEKVVRAAHFPTFSFFTVGTVLFLLLLQLGILLPSF